MAPRAVNTEVFSQPRRKTPHSRGGEKAVRNRHRRAGPIHRICRTLKTRNWNERAGLSPNPGLR
jgi:hypothetical protein